MKSPVSSWARPLGLALSYPSTVLGAAFMFKYLVDEKILGRGLAVTLFIALIANTIVLLIIYALYKKRS